MGMTKITVENYRDDKYYPKIVAAVARCLEHRSFVAPIDVFSEMGLLAPADLARWKKGQVHYLERVIQCNLSKASRILQLIRFHAHDLNLGPSMTAYVFRKKPLRFSKTEVKALEDAYSRHFVMLGKSG